MGGEDVLSRNNVTLVGRSDGPVLVFAHGFGTDQTMWEKVLPYFVEDYRVVLFDHVGAGGSNVEAYESAKYSTLQGYLEDTVEVLAALDLTEVTFVGHSMSAMLGVALAARHPDRLTRLVLLAASASYMDRPEDGYEGGFSREDLEELFESLDANYVVWASRMAPVFMNSPQQPELGADLAGRFNRTNPRIAREFARVAFLADVRHFLSQVALPTLIMQCADDIIVPMHIGAYLHQQIPSSTLINMEATGHFPQASAPEETARTMLHFLAMTKPEVLTTA